jgi:WD40 repeat protein
VWDGNSLFPLIGVHPTFIPVLLRARLTEGSKKLAMLGRLASEIEFTDLPNPPGNGGGAVAAEPELSASDDAFTSSLAIGHGMIVAGGVGEDAVILDERTHKERRRLKSHESRIAEVAISTDGMHVFTLEEDGALRKWSVDGELKWKSGKFTRSALDLMPGLGTGLAVGSDRSIVIDESAVVVIGANGDVERRISRDHASALGLAIGPQTGVIVVGWSDGEVWSFSSDGSSHLWTLTGTGIIQSLSFDPAERLLSGVSDRGLVYVWGAPSGDPVDLSTASLRYKFVGTTMLRNDEHTREGRTDAN